MTSDYALSIPQAFRQVAGRHPDKPAVHYLGTVYTYAELESLSDRFAAGLAARGVTPGSRVVVYLPNSVQFVVAWLGILKAGALAVPITPIYTPRDLEYIARDSAAKSIICADTNFGYVTKVRAQTDLERVIITTLADLKLLMAGPCFESLLCLFEAHLTAKGGSLDPGERLGERARAVDPDDVAPPPLVTGDDLLNMGVKQGPIFKRTLDEVYYRQLNLEVTDRAAALALAQRLAQAGGV